MGSANTLTHHVFCAPFSWDLLTTSEKQSACWLIGNHHDLKWSDGDVSYREAKLRVVRRVVRALSCDEEFVHMYMKGAEKVTWLRTLIGSPLQKDVGVIVESLDVEYEDIARLEILDATNTFRCERHTRNCALENALKLQRWWIERNERFKTTL